MKWFACVTVLVSLLAVRASADTPIVGDYIEARTASVFAGACHYNGELVTTGRDALLAWKVTSGQFNGVDLAGVRAVAVVSCEANLSDASAARKSELIIDAPTDVQALAFESALRAKDAGTLGKVILVRHAVIRFDHGEKGYTVTVPRYAEWSVSPMPNDECCKMPNMVWYSPLVTVEGRKVGYTATAAYLAGTLGDAWRRNAENSAFYGTFSM